jgi:hypothetical protein
MRVTHIAPIAVLVLGVLAGCVTMSDDRQSLDRAAARLERS